MSARREFFRRVSTLLAVPWINGCERSASTDSSGNSVTEEEYRLLLDSFADTIVPEDQDPGALAAGIPALLLERFDSRPEEAKGARNLLLRIDLAARQQFNLPFSTLAYDRREKILQALESGRSPDDHPVRLELWKLRSRIIREFYQSPAGLAMLGYTPPFPAGYPDYNRPPSF